MSFASPNVVYAGLLQALFGDHPGLSAQLPSVPDESKNAVTWAERLAAAGARREASASKRVSPFTYLYSDKRSTLPARRYLPAVPLALASDVIFPQETAVSPDANTIPPDLLNLLQTELANLKNWQDGTDKLFALLDLLQRAAWGIPSSVFLGEEPDISLFDYGRVVAALLPCYSKEIQPGSPSITLISGDISGIQDFIYTITARGATSGLRGRSFYLQLLTEAVAHFVLNRLGLPPTSLLYASGGHFYLLAPVTSSTTITNLQSQISQKLLAHHGGDLFVALGTADLAEADFEPAKFGKAWQQLRQSLNRAKRRRFHELGEAMFAKVFAPSQMDDGTKESECQVCHYVGVVKEDKERQNDDGTYLRKCLLCASFEQLGNDLRQAQLVALRQQPEESATRQGYEAALAEFGLRVETFEKNELTSLPDFAAGTRLWALNDDAYEAAKTGLGDQQRPLLLRYIVNVTPTVSEAEVNQRQKEIAEKGEAAGDRLHRNQVKPFDLLQEQSQGIKRLGVLRMDVDDLGLIFSKGFGQQGGLLRTVALSWAMSLFFEGWVAKAIAAVQAGTNGAPNRDVIYAIYSGGDDLFIVGAWDVLPHLALKLTADFEAYVTGNTAVHASGGLTLHGGKFPLYQAARAAEQALDAAKAYSYDGQDKNAFTFLGRTHAWAHYRDSALPKSIVAEYSRLTALSAKEKIRHSLIRNLQRLDALYEDHKRRRLRRRQPAQPVYWGRWHWISAYQLTRLAGRVDDTDDKKEILAIRDRLSGEKFTYIERLGLAARWAELRQRDTNEEAKHG